MIKYILGYDSANKLWDVLQGPVTGATLSAHTIRLDDEAVWANNPGTRLVIYAKRAEIKNGILYLRGSDEGI